MSNRSARARVKNTRLYKALRNEGIKKAKAARIAIVAAGSSRKNMSKGGGRSRAYDKWSKRDLLARAKTVGVKRRSSMNKNDLVKALRKA